MKTTKRFALLFVLAALSNGVRAEWVEIEKFEDGMRVFVDKATARRTGDTAQVLHLVRWGEPQVEEGFPPYLSTVVRTAYDCTGKREKYLDSTSYAGSMGTGARVTSDENAEETWYSISDSSMEEKLWKIACGLR
jgi:hypothetical protein